MEQLLRGQEIPEIGYDMRLGLLFFPIRHHSPACAFHLKRAIQEYQPECILVEGPENANSLIPILADEQTRAPVALYYAYTDKDGLIGSEKEDYKCYYPFLDYSPELVALREAQKSGILVQFIDLPYAEILIGTASESGIRRESGKQSYNDDYLLSRSSFFKRLCEKTGLRSFDELWEKYFEIQGLRQETEQFVKQLHTYCYLSRQYTPEEELRKDGCLLREQYMAEQIADKTRSCRKILVVTGGFHSYGIWSTLKEQNEGAGSSKVILHRIREGCQMVYPMSYSMEATDALNGYASGMQSPGFYQQVWKGMEEEKDMAGAYEHAVLHYLVAAGKKARQKGEGISSYDEISAFAMARGLAALRGKPEPGLYELQDAALSSFVKGECSISSEEPLRILRRLVTGQQVGKLCSRAEQPPLLLDFEEQCRFFGLNIHSTFETEITLELFRREKHRRLSCFLYQTEFLGCDFAEKKKGADLAGRRDKNRVREIWRYKWSGKVTAALIDNSVLGGTLAEAADSLLHTRLAKSVSCREGAELLVKGFLMGLFQDWDGMKEKLCGVLVQDGDFFSLIEGFSHLLMLSALQKLYQDKVELDLENMIQICFYKLIQLLPSMGQIAEEKQEKCMESLRLLYHTAGKEGYSQLREVLAEALLEILRQRPIQPGIEGAVLGLLYGLDPAYGTQIVKTAEGYIRGTENTVEKSAVFLRGLFFCAKDFVFISEYFFRLIDELLKRLSANEFLLLLPQLRMAFSWFTPMETDRLAGKAAALYGKKKEAVLKGRIVSPQEYAYGEELDAYLAEKLGELDSGKAIGMEE